MITYISYTLIFPSPDRSNNAKASRNSSIYSSLNKTSSSCFPLPISSAASFFIACSLESISYLALSASAFNDISNSFIIN